MKKTNFIICVFIVFLISFPAKSQTALGIMVGEPTGLSLRFGRFPVLGVAWSFRNRMHVHGDYWFANPRLSPSARLYAGAGLRLSVGTDHGTGVGGRIPLGLQFFADRRLEIFGELVPGITVIPETAPDVSGALGIRFIF